MDRDFESYMHTVPTRAEVSHRGVAQIRGLGLIASLCDLVCDLGQTSTSQNPERTGDSESARYATRLTQLYGTERCAEVPANVKVHKLLAS